MGTSPMQPTRFVRLDVYKRYAMIAAVDLQLIALGRDAGGCRLHRDGLKGQPA